MVSDTPIFQQPTKLKSTFLVLLAVLFIACTSITADAINSDTTKLPTFGKGKVIVRLYTDYFCGPCSRMEPKVEQTLLDLIKKNSITLTFVDTPVHTGTPVYAKYFLYILNVRNNVDYAFKSRAALFEAAASKIEGQEKLEEFLNIKKINFRQSDPSATLAAISSLIAEDVIKSTPTCVIIRDGKKMPYIGEADITTALQALK
jgi:hypothetical protein